MKKSNKIWLFVAAGLVVVGVALVIVACAMGGWGDMSDTWQVTHTVDEPFTKITVRGSSADLTIKRSENGTTYAVCTESDKITYSLSVSDGELLFRENDHRAWYDNIGISFGDRTTTLYLGGDAYDALTVSTSSGNVTCAAPASFDEANLTNSSGNILCDENAVFGNVTMTTSSGKIDCAAKVSGRMTVKASSGNISLRGATPRSLSVSTSSGTVKLNAVTAKEKLDVESSSGNIQLEKCDAGEIHLESSSGSIRATLLSDKLFDVRSSSGNLDYPASIKGGDPCTVVTSSGNVRIVVTA